MAEKTPTQGGSHGQSRKVDLNRVIRELNEERTRLGRIIERLEQMRAEEAVEQKPRSRRGRKSMDAAGRAEVSERMRKYWAGWRAKKNRTRESKPVESDSTLGRGVAPYAYSAEGFMTS